MRIAIFGLGYVGCISASCFARENYRVIGVDVNHEKVDIINSGKSPIVEPGLEELIRETVCRGNLRATVDYKEAVANSDISLVCVSTPNEMNGNVNLDYVYRVTEQIAEAIKQINHYHLFVIRSTVPPGTHEHAVELIAKISGKTPGEDFGVCSNPEFLREGTALRDFYAPPYTIIGEMDKKSGDYLATIYKNIDAPLIRTDVKVAELVKYANNAFHALKVAFANEIGTICKQEGIDSHKLMDIFCKDEKLNLSGYYLKPGFAFGGSCLPKDVRAITYRAKRGDLELPLLNSIMPSNQYHIQRAIDLVLSYGKKCIGILGLSFKGDTDDLRESPMVTVVETLIGKGYDIRIYDRNVHLAKIFGANKQYLDRKIPHISGLMVGNISEVFDHAELVIIGNQNQEFTGHILKNEKPVIVIDFVKLFNPPQDFPMGYEGLCW